MNNFKKGQMVMTWIHDKPVRVLAVKGNKVVVKILGIINEVDFNMCTIVI